MAISIGEVISSEGAVQVVNTETNEVRTVESGGKLFPNEVVITGADSAVSLQLIDGNIIALGRDSRMVLDNSVIPVNSLNAMTTDQLVSFEALQQAILDGNVDGLEQAGSELPPEVAKILEARSKSLSQEREQEPVSSSSDGGAVNERIALVGEVTAGYDTTAEFYDATQDVEDEGEEEDDLVLNTLPIEPETPVIPENNAPQIPNEEGEQSNNGRDEASNNVLIKLFALDADGNRVDANQVPEGVSPEYVVVAFDNNGQEIPVTGTVNVRFVDQTATGTPEGTRDDGTEDYINETLNVTIGEPFNVDTVDDYLADNGETYLAEIVEDTLEMDETFDEVIVDDIPVTTTITDDSQPGTPNDGTDGIEPDMDSVTLKLIPTDANGTEIDPATIPEGGTAFYKVILLDPNGNEITNATGDVDIVFTDGTAVRTGTEANGGLDFDGQDQTVTLNTVFSADALDDYLADSGETFNVAIVDDTYTEAAKYENVIHDTTPVVTTIIDDSQPGTPNDPSDSVEPNQEVVEIKLFAADANGNVLKDGSGNYQLANSVDEGSNANYIAYAFAPGTSTYNDSSRLANQLGQVTVIFNDGNGANGAQGAGTQTAIDGSQDFVNNGQTITLGQSFNTATFTDTLLDDNETYTVTLNANSYTPVAQGGYETVEIDTVPVTTTIKDTEPKMFVKIEPVTDTVAESGDLKYKLTIVDASGAEVSVPVGGSIDVSLMYAGLGNSPAIKDSDYTPDDVVTITEGNSSQEFTVPTIDDYYAEGDEQLQITIFDVTDTGGAFESIVPHTVDNGAPSDEITADGMIQDNPVNNPENGSPGMPNEPADPDNPGNGESYGEEDTVYAIITGPDSVKEGDTTTEYTVKLIDKDGNEVNVTQATNVTVTYSNVDTDNTDTEHSNGDTITVTIPANGSSNTFTVATNDDYYAEGDEDYKLAITQVDTNEFENTVIGDKDGNRKDVTTTIHDDSPGNQIETDPDNTKIILVATNSAGDIPLDGDGKVDVTQNTNATPEGGKLYYVAVAIDEDGKPLTTQDGTVDVAYGATPDNGTTDDYDNNGNTTVTIGQKFEVDAKDDYFAEGNEDFTVTISNPQNTPYESPSIDTNHDEVVSTITDNPANEKQDDGSTGNDDPTNGSYDEDDTVYVKITNNDTAIEGNDLTHTVTLVDKNGDPVTVPVGETVTVTITYNPDETVAGDFTAAKTTSVTISGGHSSTITHTTIDDFVQEGDESYTATITNISQANDSYENIAIGDKDGNFTSVTGTIQDGVSLGVPDNAYVDEDDFDVTVSPNIITDSESLNVYAPTGDNAYKLLFDTNVTVKDFDDDSPVTLTSNGQAISFNYDTEGKIIATSADNRKVFEITLNKNNAGGGDDNYTYTQFENIDHPDANVDDNVVLTFGYKIQDQGQTSQVQSFTVTVNDSLPAGSIDPIKVDEDGSKLIVISDESFLNGEIEINNNAGTTTTLNTTDNTTIDIYDADGDDVVGTLTNNGNGTLTFTPNGNYSGDTAGFSYAGASDTDGDTASASVSISVTPKSDAPTISDGGNETWEDTAVTINLKAPVVTDDIDKNNANGATDWDYPEKLGLISLSNMADGVQILDASDNPLWTSGGTGNKLYILLSNGDHSQDTIDNFTADANHIQMTKLEFEALKVNPVAQAHNDIDIKMSVTSYEVDASGYKLPDSQTVGTNGSTTNKTFHVEVKAVTDDIALEFDTATNGSISQTDRINDTFTHNSLTEGDGAIDLKGILTATAGGIVDLDGSENMSYTFENVPEGTVITLGSHSATANASGEVTIWFWDADYILDPDFSMKLPEHFAGEVEATVTLRVQDTDSDSSHTTDVQTQVVYFNVDVNPEADLATIQVKQSIGLEDAGRSGGNMDAKSDAIDAPENGIPLDINVSTSDTDGSEAFNVRIADIPVGAAIYYAGVAQSINAGEIIINDFDNNAPLYFIPPHNSDLEYTLKVNSQTVDTVTIDGSPVTNTSAWLGTDKDIDVIVKGVADVPVGTELKGFDINGNAGSDYNLVLNENTDLDGQGNKFDLKDVYQTPNSLDSYDSDSETLSVVISNLPSGFSVEGASMIGAGKWTFLADDLANVKITTPANFSGEASFDLKYVTTEREGDSKTHFTDTVKIFVSPTAEATVNDSSSGNEDVLFKVDLGINHQNGDTNETLEQVRIKASDVDGKDFMLYMDSNGSNPLSGLAKTNISGTDYYVLTAAQADSIYAKNTTEHDIGAGDFTFEVGYTVKDTETSQNTFDTKDGTFNYNLTINAVTDTPTASEDAIADGMGYSVSGNTVTVEQPNTIFSVPVTLTTPDQDGSESAVQYVITGVPMGVEVVGGTYYGYAGSPHNGIWVLDIADQAINDANGHTQNIEFKVNDGADFETRNISIEAFNQDTGASLESDTVTFTLEADNSYNPGTGTGTPPQFELSTQPLEILEDTDFNLGSALNVENNGGNDSGSYAITITDLPSGASIAGYDYSYEEGGVVRYVITGNGNAADAETVLSGVTITPPENVNDSDNFSQSMTFTATIATNHNGTFHQGNAVNYAEHILPVTDDMTIVINASDTQEDTDTDFTVTLSNTADQVTDIINDKLYIKFSENYEAGETAEGELWYNGAKLAAIENINGSDYFVVDVSGYSMGDAIDFTFKPGENRHGDVSFDVLVQNKEGHGWDTGVHDTAVQDSTESATIQVIPVIDGLENGQANDVSGDESTGTELNRIKMDFGGNLTDPSESIGSMTLDKIPNGFLIFYGADPNNLTMATNIGQSDAYTGTFELNPNGDSEQVNFNQWLVPLDNGQIPQEIWIQAPQNWSGNLDEVLLNLFGLSDGNQTTNEDYDFDVTFNPVADGLTIDPTLTFGDAFDWVDLKLNANMVDVDGSETMTVEVKAASGSPALEEGMLFRLSDGTWLDASFSGGTYTLEGVAYNQINDVEMLYSGYDDGLDVRAKTVDPANPTDSESTWTGWATFDFKATGSNTTMTLPGNSGDYAIQFSNGGSFNSGVYNGSITIEKGGVQYLLPSGVKSLTFNDGTDTVEEIYDNIDQSNGGSGDPTVMSAVIVDGIIEGMSYQTTSGLSGLTDAEGAFEYREGDSVTFSIGGVVLGTATASDLGAGILFLQDLADVELTNLSDEYVQKMAVFLQSLDSEGNTADGLQISEQARNVLANTTLNLSSASMDDVTTALAAAGVAPVSLEDAMSHVQEMLITHSDLEAGDFELLDNVAAADSVDEALAMIGENGLELDEEQIADEAISDAVEPVVNESEIDEFSESQDGAGFLLAGEGDDVLAEDIGSDEQTDSFDTFGATGSNQDEEGVDTLDLSEVLKDPIDLEAANLETYLNFANDEGDEDDQQVIDDSSNTKNDQQLEVIVNDMSKSDFIDNYNENIND